MSCNKWDVFYEALKEVEKIKEDPDDWDSAPKYDAFVNVIRNHHRQDRVGNLVADLITDNPEDYSEFIFDLLDKLFWINDESVFMIVSGNNRIIKTIVGELPKNMELVIHGDEE